jgi:WD40 repeat protein/serine/threonine protein kinase
MAGAPHSSHPSTEALRRFGFGALRGGEADAVEAHVETCPECCRALESFADNDFVRRVGSADRARLASPQTDPPIAAATPPGPAAVEYSVPAPLRDHPHYRVLRELGRGGMSAVYLARQTSPERLVALKVIHGGAHADPERRARLRAEADAIARLNHPNIVTIYEVGEYQGLPYLALEYVPGASLAEHVRGTPQPPRDAAALVETLAGAMHAAHKAGVIHRDLKPANILLHKDEGGRMKDETRNEDSSSPFILHPSSFILPKISDFGLAKQAKAELTATGAVLGTPNYMAPEQAAGDSAAVGPAADVWALGAILYELLTGQPPFRGVSVLQTLEQVRHQEPVSPRLLQPGVPRDLETVCLKCLEKDPARRYASAAALAEDLGRFGAGKPVRARPVGPLGRLHKSARRRPAVAALLGLVVTVSAIGLGGILWAYGQARDEARRADAKATEALQKEKEALWQAHLARLGRIDAHLLANDHAGALQVLDQLRPEYRGWEYGYLRRRAEETLLILYGHQAGVNAVCYSPDGARLASASQDRTIQLRDSRSGAPLVTFRGHTDRLNALAYSPDGARLASASHDQTVKLWDARSGTEIATLRGHTDRVNAVAYSPDGARLASASHDQTVRLWDSRSGVALATLRGHAAEVNSVAYSPDGTRLASGSLDGTVKVWDTHGGALLATLRGHPRFVLSVAYSPDGTCVAGAVYDRTIKLWDARSGAQVATLRGHTDLVNAMAYSPDGARLASAAQDGTVKVWDVRRGTELATRRGHTGMAYAVTFSPDGTRLASAGEDKTVKVWDVISGHDATSLRGHTHYVTSVCHSPDGTALASGSLDGTVRVWDARSGAALAILRGHIGGVYSVAYSPGGTRLASASADNTIKVWDARSGAACTTLRGHTDAVRAVAYSPDGTRLASASTDNTVKIWDAQSGALLGNLSERPQLVRKVSYSPDGRRLVCAQQDGTLRVWDAHSGAALATLRGHTRAVVAVAYSPDSARLASAGDSTVRVWDADSGTELATLRGHTVSASSVCFSPDGTRLASAGEDSTVRVWDAHSGAELATLRGHTSLVRSVCYSPDGTRLASAADDLTVRIWDGRCNTGVACLRGHAAKVFRAGYIPDGTRVIATDAAGTTLVWETASGNLLADAEPPPPLPASNVSPDGDFVAVPHETDVRIYRCRPVPGGYDPWAEDAECRRVQAPSWHATEMEAARKRSDDFAVAFHQRSLSEGDNLRLLAWARRAAGDNDGCLQALQQLRDEQHGVAIAWPLCGVLATRLSVQPTLGGSVGPLAAADLARREERRRAAQLVRAAALWPNSGIDAAELVALAGCCAETDLQSWQYHELLGAALYRDGKLDAAIGELDEAVRRHGAGGSLWSRLFLALAHRRLGHTEQALEWRNRSDRADAWEEAVVQRQLLGEWHAGP